LVEGAVVIVTTSGMILCDSAEVVQSGGTELLHWTDR
jgi:hypothetical protein